MPTAQEYRYQAEECLELAREAKELYVRTALVELAREFIEKARELENKADEAHVENAGVTPADRRRRA